MDRFKDYVVSADNQFGFKKVLGAVLQSAQYVILSTVMLEAAVLLTFAPLTYQKHLKGPGRESANQH